jgi:hypothetical protein
MLPRSKRKERRITEEKLRRKTSTVRSLLIIVDAFVALGGSADKSGTVSKTSLIETIKR